MWPLKFSFPLLPIIDAVLLKDYFETTIAIFIDAVINHKTYQFTNEVYTTTLGVLKNLVGADENIRKVVEVERI